MPVLLPAFVYFDLETTGLDIPTCKIVSISAICKDDAFHAFVNPCIPIPLEASRIHGIYDAEVAECETWETVGPRFMHWVLKVAGPTPVFVAYNCYRYDLLLLAMENSRLDASAFPAFENVYAADPLVIARQVIKRKDVNGSYRLASVYKFLFEEDFAGAHTSQADVEALARVTMHEKLVKSVEASAKRLKANWMEPNVIKDIFQT